MVSIQVTVQIYLPNNYENVWQMYFDTTSEVLSRNIGISPRVATFGLPGDIFRERLESDFLYIFNG